MKNAIAILISVFLAANFFSSAATPPTENRMVRVAMIGGLMKTGLWPALAKRFETGSVYKLEVAAVGNRELIAESVRAGKVDLVTMHDSETASNLLSQGYVTNARRWTRNEFVIIGPRSDPAGIRGLRDGATALKRIAQTGSHFIDYQNGGPREITAALWKKAGLQPQGKWILQDASETSEQVLESAQKKKAYLVLGRLPSVPKGMEILVQGDPNMHRSFVVMEANPSRFPHANAKGASALANELLSTNTQDFLLMFGTNNPVGMPLFSPVKTR